MQKKPYPSGLLPTVTAIIFYGKFNLTDKLVPSDLIPRILVIQRQQVVCIDSSLWNRTESLLTYGL